MSDSPDQGIREKWHPEVFETDVPRLEQELMKEQFFEMSICLEKAVGEIKQDPLNEGADLTRPPLEAFRKKKFHSQLKPPRGKRADMRLVFRYNQQENTLYFFGFGLWKQGLNDDVYEILNPRDDTKL